MTTGAFSSLCGRKVTKHTVVASADYRRILHTDLLEAVSDEEIKFSGTQDKTLTTFEAQKL